MSIDCQAPPWLRPIAVLAEEGGVNAVPRNLLDRLVALWTTDRIHVVEVRAPTGKF
jgi:hypothetical protein